MASVRERILANLKTTVESIAPSGVPASGYTTPIKRCYRWGVDLASGPLFPLVIIADTKESVEQLNVRMFEKSLTVEIMGLAQIEFVDDATVGAYASEFIADIEKVVMLDPGRGTSGGCPNAITTKLVGNGSMIEESADYQLSVSVTIEVKYRQRIGDPSAQMA
jgi:hypothetical protein